jgi:hypothetical protein
LNPFFKSIILLILWLAIIIVFGNHSHFFAGMAAVSPVVEHAMFTPQLARGFLSAAGQTLVQTPSSLLNNTD